MSSVPSGNLYVRKTPDLSAANGTPPYTFRATGLPTGLSVVGDQLHRARPCPGAFMVEVTTAAGSDSATLNNYNQIVVSGLDTQNLAAGGGTVVALTGSGFTGAYADAHDVLVSGVSEAFTVVSDTEITFVMPARPVGTQTIQVNKLLDVATTTVDTATITVVPPAPTLTGFDTPDFVEVDEGGTSRLLGTNLSGVNGVTIGGVAASFTVMGPTMIDVTLPTKVAAGATPIEVTMPGGTASLDLHFYVQPQLTQINPATTSAAGRQTITLTGSGFTGPLSDVTDVTLTASGGTITVISSPNVVRDTQIPFAMPAVATGVYSARVHKPVTRSNTEAVGLLSYAL